MLDARVNFITGQITHNRKMSPTISTIYRASNAIPNLKLKAKLIKHWWHLLAPGKFMRTDYFGRYEVKINDPKDGWWFNFYVLL